MIADEGLDISENICVTLVGVVCDCGKLRAMLLEYDGGMGV